MKLQNDPSLFEQTAFSRILRGGKALVAELLSDFDIWCHQRGVPPGIRVRMGLVVEEAVTNIVEHGYGKAGGPFEVYADVLSGVLWVTLVDYAENFNPLLVPEPDDSLPLGDRHVGGLGIYLLRRMADWVTYQRVMHRGVPANRIDLGKTLYEKKNSPVCQN